MRLLTLLFLASVISSIANASNLLPDGKIDMVAYTSIEVNGITYKVPLANDEYIQKIYYLKKALIGDREALEILLEDKDENAIFIGDSKPLWLLFNEDGKFKVFDPGAEPAKSVRLATYEGAKPVIKSVGENV